MVGSITSNVDMNFSLVHKSEHLYRVLSVELLADMILEQTVSHISHLNASLSMCFEIKTSSYLLSYTLHMHPLVS
jgi:hypothetical protein